MSAKKEIVILGAGGLARETKYLIDHINRVKDEFKFIGYIVSDLTKLSYTDAADQVIGDMTWFEKRKDFVGAAVGIGTPKYRLKVVEEVLNRKSDTHFPTLIHPSVIYDKKSCVFERGVIVCAYNVLTVNIKVKEFAFLNLSCTFGHETIIGEGSVINPSANISGAVKIGKAVLVGTGAQILQYLTIGDYAQIGASACVTRDVPAGTVMVGVPARPVKRRS